MQPRAKIYQYINIASVVGLLIQRSVIEKHN